jgi:hypothetical protein
MSATSQSDNHGLVRPWERGRSFQLEHLAPSPALERIVECHWTVHWDLRDRQPFRQEILPHPSINLVVEPDQAWVWGVPTKRDTRMLKETGWAVGTKFQPGAFTACTGIEASHLTDSRSSIHAAFGDKSDVIASLDGRNPRPRAIIAAVETMLAPYAGLDDPALDLVHKVMDSMRHIAPGARVEDIAAVNHLAPPGRCSDSFDATLVSAQSGCSNDCAST